MLSQNFEPNCGLPVEGRSLTLPGVIAASLYDLGKETGTDYVRLTCTGRPWLSGKEKKCGM